MILFTSKLKPSFVPRREEVQEEELFAIFKRSGGI